MFLVDTNVISEMRKLRSGRIDSNVDRWARSARMSDLYIATITVFELQLGLLAIERRDKRQADLLRIWLRDFVVTGFEARILPMTTEIAVACAALNVPDRRPLNDAIIAATALAHDLTLVTRNIPDFAGVDIGCSIHGCPDEDAMTTKNVSETKRPISTTGQAHNIQRTARLNSAVRRGRKSARKG